MYDTYKIVSSIYYDMFIGYTRPFLIMIFSLCSVDFDTWDILSHENYNIYIDILNVFFKRKILIHRVVELLRRSIALWSMTEWNFIC